MNLLNAVARHWAPLFWSVSVQATILIALVYAIAMCFRRLPARYRYGLWLLVLARLAVPVPISSPLGIGQYPERIFAISIQWISGQTGGTPYLKPGQYNQAPFSGTVFNCCHGMFGGTPDRTGTFGGDNRFGDAVDSRVRNRLAGWDGLGRE